MLRTCECGAVFYTADRGRTCCWRCEQAELRDAPEAEGDEAAEAEVVREG